MPTYDIREERVEAQAVLSVRVQVLPHEVGEALAKALPRIQQHIEELGIQATSPPFARYHGFGDKLDLEAGIGVSRPAQGAGDIVAGELPGGNAAVTTHIGPYDELPQAHAAVVSWAHANKRAQNGGPYEVYLTDPGDEPDSRRWQTRVVLPLAD